MIGLRSGYKLARTSHAYPVSTATEIQPGTATVETVMLPDIVAARDQLKQVPCCVSCAIVKAMEAIDGLTGSTVPLSPMYHYYFASGGRGRLTWMTIDQGLATALKGVCAESLYPSTFSKPQLSTPPSTQAKDDAERRKLIEIDFESTGEEGFWQLSASDRVKQWQGVLRRGIPIVLGFWVVEEYRRMHPDHPAYSGESTHVVGADRTGTARHAAAVLGYRIDPADAGGGAFRVVDSRGGSFGDHGRWWLPFQLTASELVIDAWAIRFITYGSDD